MEKFQNKYRIPSARHPSWDYRWNAAYFITICTKNHEHYFGEIESNEMMFSPVGIVADILWYEIKSHASNVELGEFVIMPNHVHGILILTGDNNVETLHATSKNRPDINTPTNEPPFDDVETLHATSLQIPDKNQFMADISPKSNSVSSIIRSYKSAVSKHANRLGYSFEWQTRFHDHIIRNHDEYLKISTYIYNNRQLWVQDKFNNLSN